MNKNEEENVEESIEKEIASYEKYKNGYQEWRAEQNFNTPNATSYLAEKFWRDHSDKWPILSKIAKKVKSPKS